MNLFSVVHFRNTGSTVVHDSPRLIADHANSDRITSVGNLPWAEHQAEFDALAEGQSSVVAIKVTSGLANEGWRVTRVPSYQHGRVVFDEHAKEYVLLSNGKCVLDHSSPEDFQRSHIINSAEPGLWKISPIECQWAPSEALAMRVSIHDGEISVAWTYRAVDPCNLRPVPPDVAANLEVQFKTVLEGGADNRKKANRKFRGRI